VLVLGAGADAVAELWIPPVPAGVSDELRGLVGRPMGFVYDEARWAGCGHPLMELRPLGRRSEGLQRAPRPPVDDGTASRE
jgi:hypothetical protein